MDTTEWLGAWNLFESDWHVDVVSHGYWITKLVLLVVVVLAIRKRVRTKDCAHRLPTLHETYDSKRVSGLWIVPFLVWGFETAQLRRLAYTCPPPAEPRFWIYLLLYVPLASLLGLVLLQFFLVGIVEGRSKMWCLGLRRIHRYVAALVVGFVFVDLACKVMIFMIP